MQTIMSTSIINCRHDILLTDIDSRIVNVYICLNRLFMSLTQ